MAEQGEDRATFAVEGLDIIWYCAGCGKRVEPGDGYLEVDHGEAAAHLREIKTFEYNQDPSGLVRASDVPLFHRVPWVVWHAACDPADYGYNIAVEQIDTLPRLVHWAAHLSRKEWIGQTDWSQLLARIGDSA